jgi:hypothetical protein
MNIEVTISAIPATGDGRLIALLWYLSGRPSESRAPQKLLDFFEGDTTGALKSLATLVFNVAYALFIE